MADWETSGRVKIERAKKHLRDLIAAIAVFREGDPYVIGAEIDHQTGEVVVTVEVRALPPLEWGAVAGDAVNNLRSALNILWRIIWPASVLDENRKDDFPILTAQKFERRFGGEPKPERKPVVDLLRVIQPYEPGGTGGNALLWKLAVLNDSDKHHLLIPVFVGMTRGLLTITPAGADPTVLAIRVRGQPYAIHQSAEVLRMAIPVPAGTQVNVKAELSLQVAFGEPKIVEGEEIVSTLAQLVGVVEGVVETFRIAGLLSPGAPTQSAPPDSTSGSGSHPDGQPT